VPVSLARSARTPALRIAAATHDARVFQGLAQSHVVVARTDFEAVEIVGAQRVAVTVVAVAIQPRKDEDGGLCTQWGSITQARGVAAAQRLRSTHRRRQRPWRQTRLCVHTTWLAALLAALCWTPATPPSDGGSLAFQYCGVGSPTCLALTSTGRGATQAPRAPPSPRSTRPRSRRPPDRGWVA
jgi:hypothetical protein